MSSISHVSIPPQSTASTANYIKDGWSPGQVAQEVSAASRYVKVVGSISSQGTDKKQQMNA